MIFDGVPFEEGLDLIAGSKLRKDALSAIGGLLEEKTRARVMFDARQVPFGKKELIIPTRLGLLLKDKGIITSFSPVLPLPDEPPFRTWTAICNDTEQSQTAGASFVNDSDALYGALAEGLERYLWFEDRGYFESPVVGTALGVGKGYSTLLPEQFIGFSEAQRAPVSDRILHSDAKYLWIRGTSLVSNKPVMLPAQVVSGVKGLRSMDGRKEPLIRQGTTTGLATWPTKNGARLRGMLEIIERDAYMIMWLNQLIVPRIALEPLCAQHESIRTVVETCKRYRLKVHALYMPTDAPAHAVCIVLEDTTAAAPRYAFGLKAGRELPLLLERGILEALRARRAVRQSLDAGITVDSKIETIGHRERLFYWAQPENAVRLTPLFSGIEKEITPASWDHLSDNEYLRVLLSWCKEKHYECASVSLGISKKNPTPWSVEMVVMPDMQPTYLHESLQAWGGVRLTSIPKAFGYTPRSFPYGDGPHPFA